jgi:hypothetical protein
MYNHPFAGSPVIYHSAPESSDPWQTQYSMVTVAAPPPPPTCFIAYPDYSNPGAYTYVPVPTMPTGYAPALAAVDPYTAAAPTAAATSQISSSGFGPTTASMSATCSNQPEGHQPLSATGADDDDDCHSDSSTSSKKLLTERIRKPKLTIPIGHAPEADPNSKTGTYAKPLASQPNPACTLVLDSIPTRFRNPSWVHKWAVNAGEAEPVCVEVDTKGGKALVEFEGAASARKAFQSKQLKGKGKHAIRAWWYRVTGVGSNAGVGEIEEGEVEDGSTKKSEAITRLNKSQKKKLQRKQQTTQNPQGGSSGALVAASEDTTVGQKAHAPPVEREETSVDAVAPRVRRFSFDGLSVRFDVSSGAHDGIEVGQVMQDDNEDRLSIASSQPSSTPLLVSHDDGDEDMDISTPIVTSRSDPLLTSEDCGSEGINVDPLPSSMDIDVDSAVTFVSADNPVPGLDSEVARPQQQDINPVEVPARALTLSPPVYLNSYLHSTPTDLQSSLLCTEEPAEKFLERSHSAELPSLAREEDDISNKSAAMMEGVDMVDPVVSTSTLPSSPSQLPVPLAREPSADKIALEMNLRRLVRESKQTKPIIHSATASPASSHSTPLPPASSAINGDIAIAQHSPAVSPATCVLPVFSYYFHAHL